MVALWNNAEGGTNGTIATTVNTGGNSGNAFTSFTGTPTFDNTHAAHGSLSYKITNPAGSNSALLWTTNETELWGRSYVYMTQNFAISRSLCRLFNSGGGVACIIGMITDGTLVLVDSAGTTIGTTTHSIVLNAWARFEFHCLVSATAGVMELRLYNSADSMTSTETLSFTNQNTGTTAINSPRFGILANQSAVETIWMDSLNVNTDGFPGPDVPHQSTLQMLGVG